MEDRPGIFPRNTLCLILLPILTPHIIAGAVPFPAMHTSFFGVVHSLMKQEGESARRDGYPAKCPELDVIHTSRARSCILTSVPDALVLFLRCKVVGYSILSEDFRPTCVPLLS